MDRCEHCGHDGGKHTVECRAMEWLRQPPSSKVRPPRGHDDVLREKAEEFAQAANVTLTEENEAIVNALLCVATQVARLVEVSK